MARARRKDNNILLAGIAMILLMLAMGSGLLPLSIIAVGPEGLDANVYKIEYHDRGVNEYAILGQPSTYRDNTYLRIENADPKDVVVNLAGNIGDVEIQVTRPIIGGDPNPPDIGVGGFSWQSVYKRIGSVGGSLVSQAEKDTIVKWNESKTLANGSVISVVKIARVTYADMYISIRMLPGGGTDSVNNLRVWVRLDSISWQRLIGEPKPNGEAKLTDKKGVVIPIMAFVKEAYQWVWVTEDGMVKTEPPGPGADSLVDISPSNPGAELTLFTAPSDAYRFTSDVKPSDYITPDYLRSWAPDYRMSNKVYFSILVNKLDNYRTTKWGFITDERYYPATLLKVRVVVLVVGEFHYLWSKENAGNVGYSYTPATSKTEHNDAWWADLARWTYSPTFRAMLLSILVVLVLVYLAQTGVLAGLIALWGSRRK